MCKTFFRTIFVLFAYHFLTTDFSTTCNNFLGDFVDNYTPIFFELMTPMSWYFWYLIWFFWVQVLLWIVNRLHSKLSTLVLGYIMQFTDIVQIQKIIDQRSVGSHIIKYIWKYLMVTLVWIIYLYVYITELNCKWNGF